MAAELQSWKPQTLRLSIFCREFIAAEQRPSSSIYGVEAESQQISGPAKDLLEVSSYGVGKMMITVSGNRMDLTWRAGGTLDGISSLGDVQDALDALVEPANVWLLNSNLSIVRVALGAEFHLPVADESEGQGRLAELLPKFHIAEEAIEDFQIQFNRVCSIPFRDGELRINRISRWRAGPQQMTLFEFGPAGPQVRTGLQGFAVECHQDFNTDAKGVEPPMTGREAANVASQLAKESRVFLERGDNV